MVNLWYFFVYLILSMIFFFYRILLEKERSIVSLKNNDDLIILKYQINRLYEDFVEDGDGFIDMEKLIGLLQNDILKI